MNKKIYIDMDGTLCRFHDTEHRYIEQMWEPGFYQGLKPFEEFLKGISLCMERNPDAEFYILSAYLDTEPPFVREEKRAWLHEHLPQLPEEHMIFVPAGQDKALFLDTFTADCYLIDDYNKNLREWEDAGGTAIKFINDINNRGLGAYGGEKGSLWNGFSVSYHQLAEETCSNIEAYALGAHPEQFKLQFDEVLPLDFAASLPSYFHARTELDQKVNMEFYQREINFKSFESSNEHGKAIMRDIFKRETFNASFAKENETNDATVACLDSCYTAAVCNNIPNRRIFDWLLSATSTNGEIGTSYITSFALQGHINRMVQREQQLAVLYPQIEQSDAALKSLEKQYSKPAPADIAKNLILDGEPAKIIFARRQAEQQRNHNLRQQWQEVALAEYPYIAAGTKTQAYTQYAKAKEKQDVSK